MNEFKDKDPNLHFKKLLLVLIYFICSHIIKNLKIQEIEWTWSIISNQ